jgi:protein-tyrosine-phosphatase
VNASVARHRHILIVCYGNICRSPTAEALLRRELERAALASQWSVSSAGVRALEGYPAAPGAVQAAAAAGLGLDTHRSRRLTPEMAAAADLIVAMDEFIEDQILLQLGDVPMELWPVADPFGGPEEGYRRAYQEIAAHVAGFVERLKSGSGPAP